MSENDTKNDTEKWAHTVDLKPPLEAPTIIAAPRDAMNTINPLTEEACFTVDAQQYTIRDYEEKDTMFPWPDGLSALPTVDISRGSHTESQGDFHVTNLLGRGGMGIVEHANQQSLDRGVAIKRLSSERTDPRNVTALLHEAMITGSLEHPNIIPIHLLGLDQDKNPVMVMKKAEGLAWSALLHGINEAHWKNWRGDRLERHVQILIQVCNAVHFAHIRGVIHRDIKPANIMVGEYGETYLLDWGVATKIENHNENDNRIWGTPAYMAPEMAAGKQVDPQTDVFLLGSCLHEILTGFPRYRGRTARESLKLARAAAPFIFDPSVSPELAVICNKACSKDRHNRYQSAEEMRQALTTFLRERTLWELLHVANQRVDALQEFLRLRTLWELLHVANQRVDALQELLHSLFSQPGTPVMPEKNYVIFKLFNESRFGFEQVLSQVPEHKSATVGLQRCLEAMFMYAIDQRNADFAASLVTDMPWQRPDLTQKLDDLQKSLTSDSQALLRLEALRHDQDMKISSSQRASVFGGAMLTLSIFILALESLGGQLSQTQQLITSILGIVVIGLITLGITLLNRDIFLLNQVNRSLTGTLLTGFFALAVSRALSLNTGVAMEHIWQSDLLICLLIGILSGLSIRKVFFMPSLIIALALLVSLILPDLGKHALPVGLLFTSVFTLRSGHRNR